MEKLISIIVPVYNLETYLRKCIESIQKQTYTNLEIIIIDDGSTDNSPGICDELAEKDSRIKVFHKLNGGISSARNFGISVTSGDYILFVDSDDYIEENLCQKVINVFEEQNVDIVIFNSDIVDENGNSIGSIKSNCYDKVLNREEALKRLIQHEFSDYFWNKAYKKHLFNGITIPEGYYMEDMATTYKLFLNAEKIYCINEKLHNYLKRQNSIVNAVSLKLINDTFVAQISRYNHLKDIYPEIALKGFFNVALSARALYDRSLWEDCGSTSLITAVDFLKSNREIILQNYNDTLFKLYYKLPALYKIYRIMRHKIGETLKRIKTK